MDRLSRASRSVLTLVALSVLLCILTGCNRFRARKADHDVRALELALTLFYAEHLQHPTGTPSEICRLLRGENVGGQNPKRLSYIEAEPGEMNSQGEFIDPWGNAYRMVIRELPFVYSCGPDGIDQQGLGDDIGAGPIPVRSP